METEVYRPTHNVRFVTASALFDGHDAAINIMRRILQDSGVEVIHLGHNRSVEEVVNAAIQEDVQGIAMSSYQGGHVEYLKYMFDLLQQQGAGHIKIFAGGGGVIVPSEIKELHDYGIARIFSPNYNPYYTRNSTTYREEIVGGFNPLFYARKQVDRSYWILCCHSLHKFGL